MKINHCAHIICRTTEPCRYGAPTLPDPIHERRSETARVIVTEEGGNDFPPQSFPV